MVFRNFLSVGSIVCIFVFVTTLLAQNREQQDVATELRDLRVSYRDAMVSVVDIMELKFRQGRENIDGLLKAQVALAEAKATVAANPAEKIAALESSLAIFEKWEEVEEMKQKLGTARIEELAKCKAARIYAKIMVLEERERQHRSK